MNNLEFNTVYNELVFTEYEMEDVSYIEIPGEEDWDQIDNLIEE